MRYGPTLNVKLSALGDARVTLDCSLCARHGQTTANRLLTWFGDMALVEVMPKLAVAKKCPRAIQQEEAAQEGDWVPDLARCRIRCDYALPVKRETPMLLGTAFDEGWQLTVICDSHHAGLKSMRPCLNQRTRIDMETLVIALGHMTHVDQLERMLRCPRCGRRGVALVWSLPGGADAQRQRA